MAFLKFSLSLLVPLFLMGGIGCEQNIQPASSIQIPFSSDIEQLLKTKQSLMENLSNEKEIQEEILSLNQKRARLRQQDIQKLDEEWRSAIESDRLIQEYTQNKAGIQLSKFKKMHPEFSEIFLTDQYGLNVAQTNRTSDFYQADEKWWQDSFAEGKGKAYHGNIEYDESSRSEAISVYVPIRKTSSESVIGVIKAVMDLHSLGREL